jgi:hypothetical protein
MKSLQVLLVSLVLVALHADGVSQDAPIVTRSVSRMTLHAVEAATGTR